MPNNLLQSKPKIVNIGLAEFAETAEAFGSEALQVEWRPPAQGDSHLNEVLVRLEGHYDQIAKANEAAVAKVLSAQPMWIDVGPALDVIPGFTKNTVLHAGPPVKWEDMCGPMKGAVVGGLIFEGLATTPEEALTVASSGQIDFSPCHHFSAVGPMAGVITASMPVMVVENTENGNRAYSNFNNEKSRKALSFGAFDQDVQNFLA